MRISIGSRRYFQTGEWIWPIISGRRGRAPPTILGVGKLDASIFHVVQECGQKFISFCHSSRVWRTDRRTDGWTAWSWQYRSCIKWTRVGLRDVKVSRPLFWSRSRSRSHSNWSWSRSRSHEVMVSGLIRVGLVVSKRSFAFLIN